MQRKHLQQIKKKIIIKSTVKVLENGCQAETCIAVSKRFHHKVPLPRKNLWHVVKRNRSGRTNTVIDDLVWCKWWWPNWIGGLKEIQRLCWEWNWQYIWCKDWYCISSETGSHRSWWWYCLTLSYFLEPVQNLTARFCNHCCCCWVREGPQTHKGISQMRWHQGIN